MNDQSGKKRYLAVVCIAVEPAWLALDRKERAGFTRRAQEVVARHPDVSVEWLDGDGLSGRLSDIVTCGFNDLEAYQFLWEGLRDEPLFTLPYMRIVDVILARHGGYQAYEARSD